MIQKVQNVRKEIKPDYNGFIQDHVKFFVVKTKIEIKLSLFLDLCGKKKHQKMMQPFFLDFCNKTNFLQI